jgi:hypothetical protein
MLTVGGSLNQNVTSGCDWEEKGVAIIDLSTKTWGSVFNAKAPAYTVTQDTVNVIGGTPKGGATMLAPVGGFANTQLNTIFFPPKKAATPSGTGSAGGSSGSNTAVYSPLPEKKVSGGAIAGGVIAGLAGLGLVAGLIFFLVRRRRQQNYQATMSNASSEHEKDVGIMHELAGKNDYSELGSQNRSAELGDQHEYAELGAAPQYELAAPEQAYELGTGQDVSKRESKIELARSPAGDETEMRTQQEALPLPSSKKSSFELKKAGRT